VKRTFAEFFAGIGLVNLGLGDAWSCVYANDNDPAKRAMYADNFPSHVIDGRDIREVQSADVPACDLWTASFPCNNTSLAGSYDGIKGESSSMIHEFLRLVEDAGEDRPLQILLENVWGLLLREDGADLYEILLGLNKVGYAIDVLMLDAKWWVPQSRRRLFVLATKGEPAAHYLLPTPSRHRPEPIMAFARQHADLHWAFADTPAPLVRQTDVSDVIESLDPEDDRWWDEDRASYLFSQFSERHRKVAENMVAGNSVAHATVFRRVRRGRCMAELRTDGIAGCLRTPRGGSGRQILFEAGCGAYRVRLLNPRECARLQGVPDTYRISVKDNAALFGFGDAVCVPVIGWLSEHGLPRHRQALQNLQKPTDATVEVLNRAG
jgi:DNA (cytosine-5)-methyltransferase 1